MNKLFGNKAFYKRVILLTLPIIVQNAITNFVNLLDNIMVGRVGTEAMSGVAIVNQLAFVFSLLVFGAVSAAGIFGAQYYGQRNHEGVRYAFRFKLISTIVIAIVGMLLFVFAGEQLIGLYLHEDGGAGGNLALTLEYAKEYMLIMLIQMIPFAVIQAYSGTLRETGETFVPMLAGIVAVFVNLVFNYLLIFGKFGFPELGVAGAAIATVLSRFVELAIVVIWTHYKKEQNIFIQGAYKSMYIPGALVKSIFIKGTPLIANEGFWAAGMAVLNQCYSVRGLSVVGATNISSTIVNLFNVVFIALGSTVAIIVGQHLGADEKEEAKLAAYRLITFSVLSCFVMGGLLAAFSTVFPQIYNTTEEIQSLASKFILISAAFMPMHAFLHASYFTMRSGGKTVITFLFDSVYIWVASIPLAFCLTRFTTLTIVPIFFWCSMIDAIKCVIGFILVKKGVWIQNITTSLEE